MFLFSGQTYTKAITLHVVLLPQWMENLTGLYLKIKSARPVTTTEEGESVFSRDEAPHR